MKILQYHLSALLAIFCCPLTHGQTEPEDNAAPATAAPTTTTFAVTPAPQKENFHIYLLMGQSNMAGRGAITPTEQKTNPRVLALTPEGQWVEAKDPLHEKVGRTEPGVGPGMSFALEMIKSDPKITIGLVPCAVGGTPLKRWVKRGDLYKRAVERAELAAQAGTLSGVLWHQGEADSGKQATAEIYEQRLSQMIEDLRSDLGAPNLPVVVGQLGEFLPTDRHPFVETVRAALKRVPSDVPQVGYADSTGLIDKGDKLHFNAAAQTEFGKRYAAAMQKISPNP